MKSVALITDMRIDLLNYRSLVHDRYLIFCDDDNELTIEDSPKWARIELSDDLKIENFELRDQRVHFDKGSVYFYHVFFSDIEVLIDLMMPLQNLNIYVDSDHGHVFSISELAQLARKIKIG